MQISTSNLLIAAQQSRAQPQHLQSGFAQTLSAAKDEATAIKSASFEPVNFTPSASSGMGNAQPKPALQTRSAAPMQTPGSRLDIRI